MHCKGNMEFCSPFQKEHGNRCLVKDTQTLHPKSSSQSLSYGNYTTRNGYHKLGLGEYHEHDTCPIITPQLHQKNYDPQKRIVTTPYFLEIVIK
jgi:hypothetical protein